MDRIAPFGLATVLTLAAVFPPDALRLPDLVTLLPGAPVQWPKDLRFPTVPDELPLFAESPAEAPVNIVWTLLAGKGVQLQPFAKTPLGKQLEIEAPDTLLGATENDHQKAWADQATGDAAVYPTLEKLPPLSAEPERIAYIAAAFLETRELGLQDDTSFFIDEPLILMGASGLEGDHGWTETDPQPYLAYVAAHRIIGDRWAVDGPGSRALAIVGRDGTIEGFLRIWRRAKNAGTVRARQSPEEVRSAIDAQLRPATKIGSVTIVDVALAYYDGNGAFLQPVYRFTARIRHRAYPDDIDEYVTGYVPYAEVKEPIPRLDAVDEAEDEQASGSPPPGDPSVGRYVIREDDAGWQHDATAFWTALSHAPMHTRFTSTQHFVATPPMFTSRSHDYIDSVNVALVEAHGDWWSFTTKGCCGDGVKLAQLPPYGYGKALATWILHGCEIVPTKVDTPDWAGPWRRVFGGLRNVVGYRRPMLITDGAGAAYGASLGKGVPVVSSWISDVASLSAYGRPWRRKAYAHDGRLHPLGRPSAIAVCGHGNDSAFSTSPITGPPCLSAWWLDD